MRSPGWTDAEASLEWAVRWDAAREDVTDGQFLFELNCARCHTQGWSIFDPTVPDGTDVLGLAGGGGGRAAASHSTSATARRNAASEPATPASRFAPGEFVTLGSEANEQYGNGGIGSGRMPGFGEMLTEDMINEIVDVRARTASSDTTSYDIAEPSPSATTTTEG